MSSRLPGAEGGRNLEDNTGRREVRIAAGIMSVMVETPEGPVEIARIQDTEHRIEGEWAKTSRPAPPAVLQPLVPVTGVRPLGELELIDMLLRPDVIVVDSRKPDQYARGTIPGAVNIPFAEADERLELLGCSRRADGWDCGDAQQIALFCNGAWCGQSPTAIRRMVAAGYPPERMFYYRNGMQGWLLQGLTVHVPGSGAGAVVVAREGVV